MNKKMIAVLLLLIYISAFAFAIEVSPVANPNTVSEAQTTTQQIVQIKAQLDQMSAKMETLATNQQVLNLLQGHLEKVNQIQEQFRSSLVVNLIIIGSALIGFGFGIFLFLKGKGRL